MDTCIALWVTRNNQKDATFPLSPDNGRSPHAYVNQRLQIQLELLTMSRVPLETCWVFNERWNNKFYYKAASCWLFLLNLSLLLDWLRAGRSWDRIPMKARFSALVQTGPGSHRISCTMDIRSFPGLKSGRGVKLIPRPFLVSLVMKE
jgi:hypothetical protein